MSPLPNNTPDPSAGDGPRNPDSPDPMAVGQWRVASDEEVAAADWTADPNADGLLAAPPSTVSDDDLVAALSAPPPTARSLRLTRVLAGALVLVAGFVGGVLVAQNVGSGSTASGPTGDRADMAAGAMPSDMPSGMAGGGFGGAQSDSNATTGEVTLVDGQTIYLTSEDGTLVRVDLTEGTTIEITSAATSADVEEGDTVTVTGTTNDSGLTATTVEVSK